MNKDSVVIGVVPQFILRILKVVAVGGRLPRLYVRWTRMINYAIVCGIGIGINMAILHGLIVFFPLAVANLGAILVAWTWNYTMSVGRLGYLWGFMYDKDRKDMG